MKRLLLAAVVLALVPGYAAAAPVAPPRPADHVLVLMLDGTRPDLLRLAKTPNLDALAAAGTQYLQARTIYPSQTRVAFVSMPTGAWPSSHGIMGGDHYMDAQWHMQTFGEVTDPIPSQSLVKRPTVFEEATAAGLTSLYAAMKGYELVGARGATWTVNMRNEDAPLYATIYKRELDGSEDRAVQQKLQLSRDMTDRVLAILSDKKPNLMVVNLAAADYMGHVYGPSSPHYRQAFEFIDGLIGELLARLDALGMRERTAIIVSADHGFSDIGHMVAAVGMRDGARVLEPLVRAGIASHLETAGGSALAVYLKDHRRVSDAVGVLRAQPWTESVYCESAAARCDRTLSSLHALFPGRSPDIMVDIDDDATIAPEDPMPGNHGSLREPDMRIPLILSGAGVKPGQVLGKARLIDIAPTAIRLLGLPGRVLRPDGSVLAAALAR